MFYKIAFSGPPAFFINWYHSVTASQQQSTINIHRVKMSSSTITPAIPANCKQQTKPKISGLKNKSLQHQTQEVVMNVLDYFQRESENGGPFLPLTSLNEVNDSFYICDICVLSVDLRAHNV